MQRYFRTSHFGAVLQHGNLDRNANDGRWHNQRQLGNLHGTLIGNNGRNHSYVGLRHFADGHGEYFDRAGDAPDLEFDQS
jgi:hypothetical protein